MPGIYDWHIFVTLESQSMQQFIPAFTRKPKAIKSRKKLWWILGISFFVILVIPGVTLALLIHNPALSAEAADHVLRPVLGEKGTIAIEGIIFGLQDKLNHSRYSAPLAANYQSNISVSPLVSPSGITSTQPPHSEPSATPLPSVSLPEIHSIYTAGPSLPNEGTWQSIPGGRMYKTFVRTDNTRPYAVVNLVLMPMNQLSIGAVAGIQHPGGELKLPGPGKIPDAIQHNESLVAAFNGGFQEKDGHFGMVVGNTTYVPLRKNLATLFIYQDGHASMDSFDGKPLPADVTAARQNGLFLVRNGVDTSSTSAGIELWAGTANGDYITWRSGLGITQDGNLIYAVGPSLTPTALADALRIAGSVNAMQLDVNDFWVRFMVYTPTSNGSYSYTPLIKALANGGKQYLSGYEKDFFYVFKK